MKFTLLEDTSKTMIGLPKDQRNATQQTIHSSNADWCIKNVIILLFVGIQK
jgi:hypothetical protein